MKKICVYNRKGGTGKSSFSVLLSRYLSKAGEKVLFIDLDPQRTATNIFGRLDEIPRQAYLEKNIYQVFKEKMTLQDSMLCVNENLFLVGSSFDLSDLQSNMAPFEVKNILKGVKGFKYCIMDHGPNFNSLILSGIFASDLIIIPTFLDIENLEQTEWTFTNAKKINPKIERSVLYNRFNSEKPTKFDNELLEIFEPMFNNEVFKNSIPDTTLLKKYFDTGEQITNTAKNKTIFLDKFSNLVKEITDIKYNVKGF